MVEVFDPTGIRKQSVATDTNGSYSFTMSPADIAGNYKVVPMMGSTLHGPIPQPLNNVVAYAGASNLANFQISGMKASVTVSGTAGSFVVLSLDAIAQNTPPTFSRTSTRIAPPGVINANGSVALNVAVGGPYFLTCWVPTTQADNGLQNAIASVSYVKHPGAGAAPDSVGNITLVTANQFACPD